MYTRTFEDLEDPISALLRDHVDSYEKLEAVVVVRERSGPTPLRDIAAALRLSLADAKRTVAALCASGLLVQHADGHVSESSDDRMRTRLDALVRAYQADALAVGSMISRQALMRLRQSSAFKCFVARSARGRVR